MKTKNLIQTVLFALAFVMINQVLIAQGCYRNGCKNGLYCNCLSYVPKPNHCHCISYPGFKLGNQSALTYETSLTDVYPNPVSGAATISFSLAGTQRVSLKIVDLNGRLITTLADQFFDEGDNEIMWNTNEVNAGIYLLQFQSAALSVIEKIVVTN